MIIATHNRITRQKMLLLLDELEAAGGQATTLYIPQNSLPVEYEKTLKKAVGSDAGQVLSVIEDSVAYSKTGAVLFWGAENRYLVRPPFPLKEKLFASGCDVQPLRSMLQEDLLLALVLVRLGEYAVGIFRGEELVSSKVGTGLVHSRHKKGGSSARRFERHREKQIEYFFERVCGHVRGHLEPYQEQIDYLLYGGERHTLLSFRKQCRFLEQFDNRTLNSLLNVRKPGQATLEAAITLAWSSEVTKWQEAAPTGELR